jgi:hypothetical protein
MSKFASLSLAVDKPSRMVVVHPVTQQPLRSKDGTEAYISLYSGDSAVAQRHSRAIQQRRIDMRRGAKLSVQEIEAETVDLLAALTVEWCLVGLDGEPLDVPFSEPNARELYSEPGLAWLREQVNVFVADRANFSKASSTS